MVEQIGVDKAKEMGKEADLILYVVDSSVPLDENDEKIIEMMEGKQAIVLLNKTDLESVGHIGYTSFNNKLILGMKVNGQE